MVSNLPYMGIALGVIMIYWLFPDVVGDTSKPSER